MTDKDWFTDEEWRLLQTLPLWVVRAASAAQTDNALRTAVEKETGFLKIAISRESGNTFVEDIARRVVDADGDPAQERAAAAIDFSNVQAGVGAVLEQATAATQLLAAKADAPDAAAYRRWLLIIAEVVIRAARSGGVLGIGGVLVTELERGFHFQLEQALRA